jgi:hypothetical protein
MMLRFAPRVPWTDTSDYRSLGWTSGYSNARRLVVTKAERVRCYEGRVREIGQKGGL